ncbi:helix-hairpin-helix domain-containing protein [Actinoplanes sp. NPDC051861]|uniref:helix-hairpin-helix domain-containing protein n=1 Tax=Actinoplanes sp. NPDC051861 TaxID=3155170 RepID=UPI00342AF3F4
MQTIVRPRFYCGQLLTDLDMSALVDWTRQRLGLVRHRDGWGVVCGLDVRGTPGRPTTVTIRPGYAVGALGNDILVGHDHTLDLAAVAEDEQKENTLTVDVLLDYGERDTDPHTTFAKSCCAETAACENSRTREGFHAYARRAEEPVDAAAWKLGYDACLGVVDEFRKRFPSFDPKFGKDMQRWLWQWIDKRTPRIWCDLRSRVTATPSEKDLTQWLFELVQEARGAYLTGPCETPCDGVRLARAELTRVKNVWGIRTIDVYPPYRRPLSTDAWPAPLGSVNAAQMIWHRWPEACTRFADLGVKVTGTSTFTVPATVAALRSALACDPFIPCHDAVKIELYGPEQRVVGFCGGDRPLAVAVFKKAKQGYARPGANVDYEVRVRNDDETNVDIVVVDSGWPTWKEQGTLKPGEEVSYNYAVPTSAGATGTVKNTVSVTAKAGTRQRVVTAQTTLPVPRIRLEKSGPKKAVPGAVVQFRFRVYNDSEHVTLPIAVGDNVLGPIGQAEVGPGEHHDFPLRNWEVPKTVTGPQTNQAAAEAIVDGQVVAEAGPVAHTVHVMPDVTGRELILISGIAERRAEILRAGGIRNLVELAEATPTRVRELLPDLSERVVQQWIDQAKEATR